MEELLAEFFKFVGRFVAYILFEFFLQKVCYYIGLPLFKLMMLGKSPKPDSSDEMFCSILGFITFILIMIFFYSR